MDLARQLRHLETSLPIKDSGEFTFITALPERPGVYGTPADPFYREITRSIFPNGLYKHQIIALELIDSGENVVISTSTSSGKSLCYQLPLAKAILSSKKRSQRPKALVIHPTKALAQDQVKGWSKLRLPGLLVSAFDGDSSAEHRLNTRRFADVWLTNPEMINSNILANHSQYHSLLSGLDFIVLDEAHVYRGVFGSHVANLLRRLTRIARLYGSNPRYIFTSATISNPAQSCARLINQDVKVVEEDFSPQAAKLIAIWKPKVLDETTGTRSSYTRAAAAISSYLVGSDHRVITFVRSRRLSEVVANQAREIIGGNEEFGVLSYRGGYLPVQRREIEQLVSEGVTKLVVSTSAMELGVDISHLDTAVIAGFPGTFSSFHQQIGRAGRTSIPSIAILVCSPDAMDQWIGSNPNSILYRSSEQAIVNPDNPYILKEHLKAACFESPLTQQDLALFTGGNPEHKQVIDKVIQQLQDESSVSFRAGKYVSNSQKPPHHQISMRSTGTRQILIYGENGELLGTNEFAKAPSTLHEGAIYLHLGQSFKVLTLDLEQNFAIVEPFYGREQTRTIFDTSYENFEPERTESFDGMSLCLGPTRITQVVSGYQVLSHSGDLLSVSKLEMPPTILDTTAWWLEYRPEALEGIPLPNVPGALHAAEHAMISMMPIFAICDRSDIGGVSRLIFPNPLLADHVSRTVATITIYDGYPGGIGIAELAYEIAPELIFQAISSIKSCECGHGCPSCIQSPKCGNLNSPLSKEWALSLLESTFERLGTKNNASPKH
ncbi:MAG: DEAD/DEAH box helicase [Acidimicrobiaceae bacterium]|nr:DEAD/DEAH box helicase [Acidimicrobiaceae bacterium]